MSERKTRVLSGIQPTGHLHLGNYLGALKHFAQYQAEHECLYCVVDLHALTQPLDAKILAAHTKRIIATYLAIGIDPKQHILFAQSQVSAHAQLAWLLNCIAPLGWLERMTQFKQKAGKDKERSSVGLFTYPILMAADILAYHTDYVPVGEDQAQHLELARAIADKFNRECAKGDFFPIPKGFLQTQGARIMSLRDGTKKMSKSDLSSFSRIELTDTKDDIAKKIKKAKTDANLLPAHISELKTRPEANNLLGIMACLSETSLEETVRLYEGQTFSSLKDDLTQSLIEAIVPLGEKIIALEKEDNHISKILEEGASRAHMISAPILRQVKSHMGLL